MLSGYNTRLKVFQVTGYNLSLKTVWKIGVGWWEWPTKNGWSPFRGKVECPPVEQVPGDLFSTLS